MLKTCSVIKFLTLVVFLQTSDLYNEILFHGGTDNVADIVTWVIDVNLYPISASYTFLFVFIYALNS